jgi:hypothetical protein
VREFLADFLAGKIKRPEGRQRRYSDWTWATISPDGEIAIVKKEYEGVCRAAAWVWEDKRNGVAHDEAIKKAVSKFRLSEARREQLVQWLRRSKKDRKRLAARN